MKPIEKKVRNYETIEVFKPKYTKSRQKAILRESKAKTLNTLISSRIAVLKKDYRNVLNDKILTPNDLILVLEMINNKNKEFSERLKLTSWKGKSSFIFEEKGEIIYVEKWQRPEKGKEPLRQVFKILVSDINSLLNEIKKLNKNPLKSRELAESFYNKPWKDIFNDRPLHNYYTICLGVLDKKKLISYGGGINLPK